MGANRLIPQLTCGNLIDYCIRLSCDTHLVNKDVHMAIKSISVYPFACFGDLSGVGLEDYTAESIDRSDPTVERPRL